MAGGATAPAWGELKSKGDQAWSSASGREKNLTANVPRQGDQG